MLSRCGERDMAKAGQIYELSSICLRRGVEQNASESSSNMMVEVGRRFVGNQYSSGDLSSFMTLNVDGALKGLPELASAYR